VVLAFRHLGFEVDDVLHRRLTAEVSRARALTVA
jgi:hypothetical protein